MPIWPKMCASAIVEVDQMYSALFREFLTYMMEDPRHITACMHLHFMAKNIERMGDHVTSMAEQVIYLVTGEMPDEDRPKEDRNRLRARDLTGKWPENPSFWS